MRLSDFHFDLPDELIARYPKEHRSDSRLLCLDGQTGAVEHRQFKELVDQLNPEDCLIFNNTRVMPARLYGSKASGGRLEILVERIFSEHEVLAYLKANRTPKVGQQLFIDDAVTLDIVARKGELFHLKFLNKNVRETLHSYGHIPLPPYMTREDEASDKERYQTVYAAKEGAVAAPTAGLHFDDDVFNALKEKGIAYDFVTLHVGAGTFSPIRVDDVQQHTMHSEWYQVPPSVCELVESTRSKGGRVVAVGTTSVRCLESASEQGKLRAKEGETDIYIYPGYRFQCVDALITNFHLPDSTLILLVSAFAGKDHVLSAYQQAINERYRFFSYGDAMFISRRFSQ